MSSSILSRSLNNKLVFTTNSARHYKIQSKTNINKFPDGEINVSITKNIKNKNVIIIGSTQPPAENLLELLLLIDSVVQNGAKTVKVVIPYFGYARSDKKDSQNRLASVETIVKMLELVGGKNCSFTILDPHSNCLQSYFKNPFNKMSAVKQMANEFIHIKDLSIIAPDNGSKEKALEFASCLKIPKIVSINKKRLSETEVKILSVSGNVSSNVLIVDDMVASGNTILETAKVIKNKGARHIYVAVTHIVYSAGGWKKLASSKLIDKIVTTDSIISPTKLPKKYKIIQFTDILKKYISNPQLDKFT
ncbi:MAG: ribose-phosphate diphosphokinase [Patescibacteria group bacterium]